MSALRRGKVVMSAAVWPVPWFDQLDVSKWSGPATGDEVLVTGEDVLELAGSSYSTCVEEEEGNVAAAVAIISMLYCERRALPAVSAPCRGRNSSATLPCSFDSVWCSAWSLGFIGVLLRMEKDDAAVCMAGAMPGMRRIAHSCCTSEAGGGNHSACWCCCSTSERRSVWSLRLATDAASANEGTPAVEGKGVAAAAMNGWTSFRPIRELLGKRAGHAVPGAGIANTPEPVTTGQKLSESLFEAALQRTETPRVATAQHKWSETRSQTHDASVDDASEQMFF